MAKELPYFKFEPNEWENGSIQMCDRESRGLFIDLCSMYWSRLGSLPFKLAVQKLCGGNATAFDSLIEEGIFEVIDGDVCIGFLNEQLDGFEDQSKTNRSNALKGWEKRRKKDATAKRPQSDRNAIREEKKIEEDSKEDKPAPRFVFKKSMIAYGFDEELVDEWMQVRKKKRLTNSKTAFEGFIREVEKTNLKPSGVLRQCVERSWGSFKASWLENEKKFSGGSETKEKNLFEKSAEYLNR